MICGVSIKNYNNFFVSLINNEIQTAATLRDRLNTDTEYRMPSDDVVRESFGMRWSTHYIPKCILYLLETSIRNDDKQNNKLLSIGNYDLEHIMPKQWKANWQLPASDKSEEELENERNTKVNSIGNMTILKSGLNRSISNSSWNDKKEGKGNKGGLKKYGAGLETFSQYIDSPKWDEDQIDARAEFLLNAALKTWKLKG